MFTGIVTDVGTVRKAEQRGDLRLVIGTDYDTSTIDLGASIANFSSRKVTGSLNDGKRTVRNHQIHRVENAEAFTPPS